MATIVTRAGKGSALTWTEGDANIVNLNTDKLEAGPAANAALNGFTTTATAGAGFTALTNTSSVYQLFTGTASQQVRLPSTDTLTPGWSFHIVNNATNNVLLQTATPNSLITVQPGTTVMATCISTADNTTASWEAGYTDFSTATGSGAVVLGTSPNLTTPNIGVASGTSLGLGNITLAANGNATVLGVIELGNATDTTLQRTAAGVVAIEGVEIVTLSRAQTLINKTLTAPVIASIVSAAASNGNISITPDGTGQTVVKNLEYQEFVHSLGTTSGTIAPNAANGNVQTITLNGNLTINGFTTPVSGQTITLILTQDATGGRTLTSTMLFAGASKTLSTAPNAVDILTISYIGTTYYASLVKGYA